MFVLLHVHKRRCQSRIGCALSTSGKGTKDECPCIEYFVITMNSKILFLEINRRMLAFDFTHFCTKKGVFISQGESLLTCVIIDTVNIPLLN